MRLSHSHCSADCEASDAAAIGCDTEHGEVYTARIIVAVATTAQDVCGCRCVKGCGVGYRQDAATCKCICDCDPNAPAPANINPQHHMCNKWVCNDNGIGCKYVADGSDVCSEYQWPLAGAPKDPQCWAPKCVDVGQQTAECRGAPANVDPNSCPVPAGVSPYCYVKACTGTGYCETQFITSAGGKDAGSPHLGNCPVPAGLDARCYWPYCDNTGNCAADVFSGNPYTAAGNWQDGSMGTRPDQPACTVAELTDAGNAKYGKFNPDCFIARCDNGKCGGDAVNFGAPCNPIDGRADGSYNEIFVGASWPGISADCVYYQCGTNPGERGHCIQLPKAGARQTPCYNSDNNMCTNDWCDANGMCKDHEWIQGHSPEGVCVTSTCDPATGAWTYTRNGDACCENGAINFGEDCEVGLNGADAKCCVGCNFQATCTDDNVCTSDTCINGQCISSLDLSFSNLCPPLDQSIDDNRCKLVACSAESGKCEAMPDPRQEGVECSADADQCNHHVCRSGRCVLEEDNVGTACSLPASPDLTCKTLQCVAVDGHGECQAVADNTKTCDDQNPCTLESCVAGECVTQGAAISCPPAADDCHAPGVCNTATGQCDSPALDDGTVCAKPADAPASDQCTNYMCSAGQCVRSTTGACQCGNGKLDDGEVCDYSIAAQKDCCSSNCTGCTCGNGKIDAGEQCDFAIPSQLQCCSSTCQGCLCGNGVLDAGEQCDPVLAAQNGECCNPDCTPCSVVSRSAGIAMAAGIAVAALAAAFALTALLASRAASDAASAPLMGAGADAEVSQMANNPTYVGSATENQNPLFAPLTTN